MAEVVRRRSNGDTADIANAKSLGKGGEGRVVVWPNDIQYAAKISLLAMRPPGQLLAHDRAKLEQWRKKLDAMLQTTPGTDHVAWPIDILMNAGGETCGFLTRRADGFRVLQEFASARIRPFDHPTVTYGHLLQIARNLAAVFERLHASGCVVGDIKVLNILANQCGRVFVVDADSFQFTDRSGHAYPCSATTEGYKPPELITSKITELLDIAHDHFALSILIFEVLMDVAHPYSAGFELDQCVLDGKFRYAKGNVSQGVPYESLPSEVRDLFARCFERSLGHQNPKLRPSPSEWLTALERASTQLTKCPQNSLHVFSQHVQNCPWCEYAHVNGKDIFPGGGVPITPSPHRSVSAVQTPPAPIYQRQIAARPPPAKRKSYLPAGVAIGALIGIYMVFGRSSPPPAAEAASTPTVEHAVPVAAPNEPHPRVTPVSPPATARSQVAGDPPSVSQPLVERELDTAPAPPRPQPVVPEKPSRPAGNSRTALINRLMDGGPSESTKSGRVANSPRVVAPRPKPDARKREFIDRLMRGGPGEK